MRTKLFGLAMGALVAGFLAAPAGVRADDDDTPGPIDSVQDLQDSGKIAFKMADVNNDNRISQKEAVDAGNLLVGGFFFRADANGDGVVSKEEAQQARERSCARSRSCASSSNGPRGSDRPSRVSPPRRVRAMPRPRTRCRG